MYKLNFIMWRVRNVFQVFLVFFLWDSVFSDPSRTVFGYDRSKMLTYVFGLVAMRAIVLSSRSIDIGGDISSGRLTNYLLKPFSFFKYWFTRDLSSKALNLIFAMVEIVFLYIILKPQFFLQTHLGVLLVFLLSLALAIGIYFLLLLLVNIVPLWNPDQSWGPTFLLIVIVEFLAGGIFPLDILPWSLQNILYLTPFPYLLFMPLQIYLGKIDILTSLKADVVAFLWIGILIYIIRTSWRKGLKLYSSEGR